MIRKYNLRHNTEKVPPPEFGKMINGQGLGRISQLRYGICRMSFNGCEVIAVHNALVYLGIPQQISCIAFYMERFRVLAGFFGCNAYSIGKALKHFGAECSHSRNADNSDAFIITFWTKKPFLSSIHTVFCVRTASGIKVYNRFNNHPDMMICKNITEIAGKRKPIAVYTLNGIVQNYSEES